MKKVIISTVLLSVAVSFVTLLAALFLMALWDKTYWGYTPLYGWNYLLGTTEYTARAILTGLVLLDIALVVLTVLLAVSAVRLRRVRIGERRRTSKPRFPRLSALDNELRSKNNGAASGDYGVSDAPGVSGVPKASDNPGAASPSGAAPAGYVFRPAGLREFADGFREYAAGTLGLYYEPRVIRTYIAAMAAARLTIMQGISGTGKTSLAYAFGKYVGNPAVVTPVQPSWRDRTDLLGYYNEFTANYSETELLCKLYEANRSDRIYTVVLDEMNIARVEYYFAEFLSILEIPDKSMRRISVAADVLPGDPELLEEGKLSLPDNVWFAGTANNDESTLVISDKVYDRAFVIDLNSRCKPFDAAPGACADVKAEELHAMFDRAVAAEPLSAKLREAFVQLDRYLQERLGITVGNRAMKQLERFVPVFKACGGTENEAADMVLCHKILRKIEGMNPVLTRREAPGLARQLTAIFGRRALPDCEEFLLRFTEGV
ncbi:MAG: hypothetical protein ILO53_08695 [Clostridia bacterium]|nr:hypothetical protein [Clostridia bacterium]